MTALRNPLVLPLRVLFFGLVAATLYLSLTPAQPSSGQNPDKIHHFIAFYALSAAALAAFPARAPLILAAALCAFGGLIEILQGLPGVGRSREAMDWAADIIGITFAMAPLALARWRSRS